MNSQNQIGKDNIPKKQKLRLLKWLGMLIILIIGLVLIGFVYESMTEASDARIYPPPGRLVDIGGYRLHINCKGLGSPTVVIESGWGDFSSSWGWVQPEVAKTTRVCAYDRAGMGWSESGSKPRTAREFAKELHILLTKANEHGPYVMVGHSLGGYTIRVYAHDYPKEVLGLVFIDPQNLSVSNTGYKLAPKPGNSRLPAMIAKIGIVRLMAGPLGSIENLPSEDKKAYTAKSVTPLSVQTFVDEGIGMSEGAAQARAVTTLGSLPLIVLSRGKNMDNESAMSQARYLKLSTNNRHLVADRSDHPIMIEQPDAAVGAIVKMVSIVRTAIQ